MSKKIIPELIILICFLGLLGCETRKDLTMEQDDPFKIQVVDGISISLEFMNEELLIEKHGNKEINPFLSKKLGLQYKRIMTFDFNLINHTEQDLQIKLSDIQISFEGVHADPENLFTFSHYWETKDEIAMTSSSDKRKKQTCIKQFLAKNLIFIGPEEMYNKYIVFAKNFPKYGTAKIYIPVLDKITDQMIHRFEFEFTF